MGYGKEILQVGGNSQASKIYPIEGGIDAKGLIESSENAPDRDLLEFCQAPTAVYSGRLDFGKGIDLLIPAFARVNKMQPNSRLLLIGDGPLRNEIISKCETHGLSVTTTGDPDATVFLAGYREDPIRHFRFCRLFLFPSLHEGLGNSLIEGVASGVPVLASDCPWGPRSILSSGALQYSGSELSLPLALPLGVLMPLPNNRAGIEKWTSEMAQMLIGPAKVRPERSVRLAAIQRFDIEQTGLVWLNLASAMAREVNRK
ncbi:hypothetical protein BMI90_11540 [Thioclava sp. L04-15]|nr:hypothetical protein BMI90_11540 [Thioclava sp. L04-15]